MSDRLGIMETLRSTSAGLLAVRKAIAASGQPEALTEIDRLVAVAQAESDRRIAEDLLKKDHRWSGEPVS